MRSLSRIRQLAPLPFKSETMKDLWDRYKLETTLLVLYVFIILTAMNFF